MVKLRNHIVGLCALLFCIGMPFSEPAFSDCHGMEVSSATASAQTSSAERLNSGHALAVIATATMPNPVKHQTSQHDCCDGNMNHCSMAQCAGVFYANTSTPSSGPTPRVTMYFHPLRAGTPKHPSSTPFRPPILS